MKKIIITILSILLGIYILYFFFHDNECILDTKSFSSEGVEIERISEHTYEITFYGVLGRREQIVTINDKKNILKVEDMLISYDKPASFQDYKETVADAVTYKQDDLKSLDNYKDLIHILGSSKCL